MTWQRPHRLKSDWIRHQQEASDVKVETNQMTTIDRFCWWGTSLIIKAQIKLYEASIEGMDRSLHDFWQKYGHSVNVFLLLASLLQLSAKCQIWNLEQKTVVVSCFIKYNMLHMMIVIIVLTGEKCCYKPGEKKHQVNSLKEKKRHRTIWMDITWKGWKCNYGFQYFRLPLFFSS